MTQSEKEALDNANKTIDILSSKLRQADQRIEKLETGLKWYAEPGKMVVNTGYASGYVFQLAKIIDDGSIARLTLSTDETI